MSTQEHSLAPTSPQGNLSVAPPQEAEQKFLQFQLGKSDIGLLPAEMAIEIQVVESGEILPVPELPSCILGIYQWRGEMLWLVDLGHLMGFSPLSWQGNNSIIVLQVEQRTLGLVVPQVNGIGSYELQQLQVPSAELFSPELMPFVKGLFLGSEQEIIWLLNTEAIINFYSDESHKSRR